MEERESTNDGEAGDYGCEQKEAHSLCHGYGKPGGAEGVQRLLGRLV